MKPERPTSASRPLLLAAVAALCAPAGTAGGSGESALLVVDPGSAEALYVANHYRAMRQVPDANVLYMDPNATDYPSFVANGQAAFLDLLEGRGIEHVDCVVVMPGTRFYVPAPGLVSDSCFPVNRFGVAAPYTLAFHSAPILSGVPSSRINRYYSGDDTAVAFDSGTRWLSGQPSTQPGAERYFIAALLGYTGERGNTVQELIELIDRSVAVDGTHPTGTFYYLQTTDIARSGPRHGAYPAVTAAIAALGGLAQHLFADNLGAQPDCQGVMTGLADPAITTGAYTILPGAFCDHLTSYAGTFDSGSQTKMSEWITKGASATSGAVEEPCNYAGKFPHARLHLYAWQGLSLGESWLRSVRYYPFQNLFYGDPLTRPFATIPSVDVPDAPTAPVSGTVYVTPSASIPAPFAVQDVELYVDGRRARSGQLGDALPIQTASLDDGWHELRALAYETSPVRSVGSWIGELLVSNHGESASVVASASSGDLGAAFDFDLTAAGGAVTELRLVAAERVLAATGANPGTVRVFGQNLGAGPVRVQAEALFASGRRARSAPLDLTVDFSGGGAGPAPVAFAYERRVRIGATSAVELPAAFADDVANASFSVVTPPAQASLAPGATSGFRLLRPNPGASGTDALVFRVTTPSGVSNDATVTLVYEPALDCPLPANYCATAPNSVGPGATITYVGSTSLADNDAILWVSGARPGQPGLYYCGAGQTQIPFGDGFRCVSAGGVGTFRLAILAPDAFGDANLVLDLNAPSLAAGPGAIEPGDTWNFQYWYRDPGGPGGTGFNLSDAVSASFCP